MLITRETDYALRILRALSDGELHTMRALCEAEAVPQQFAYKIANKLARAGLVQNVRGAEGGCRLIGDLQQTTLLDLMEALEEKREVIACMVPGYQCQWEEQHRERCMVHRRMAEIQRKLDQELRSYTLADLLSKDG